MNNDQMPGWVFTMLVAFAIGSLIKYYQDQNKKP